MDPRTTSSAAAAGRAPAQQETRNIFARVAGLRRIVAGSFAAIVALMAASALAADDHVELRFQNCTATQQKQITEAVATAAVAIDEIIGRLNHAKPSLETEAAVDRWFGAGTSSPVVAARLRQIASRLDADAHPIEAECDASKKDTYAWTYKAMPGIGYLGFGQPFFNATVVGGFDSRMGTVIHELAHMVPGLAADDHTYAIRQMEALARDNPKIAFDNAQNYEYLVEELFDIRVG